MIMKNVLRIHAAVTVICCALLLPAGTATAEDPPSYHGHAVTQLCVSDGYTNYCDVVDLSTGEILASYSYPVPPPFQPPPPPPPPPA